MSLLVLLEEQPHVAITSSAASFGFSSASAIVQTALDTGKSLAYWRRGEPRRVLLGADDSNLPHWRRGEPRLAASTTLVIAVTSAAATFGFSTAATAVSEAAHTTTGTLTLTATLNSAPRKGGTTSGTITDTATLSATIHEGSTTSGAIVLTAILSASVTIDGSVWGSEIPRARPLPRRRARRDYKADDELVLMLLL